MNKEKAVSKVRFDLAMKYENTGVLDIEEIRKAISSNWEDNTIFVNQDLLNLYIIDNIAMDYDSRTKECYIDEWGWIRPHKYIFAILGNFDNMCYEIIGNERINNERL